MSSKAKARKEKRQQETAIANQRVVKLREAQDNKDHLSDLPMFQRFNRNGVEAVNTFYRSCPEELRAWMFDLTERNMRQMYEETWGWNEGRKKKELFADTSRYCILTVGDKPAGFINMKLEIEQDTLRVYIMEFQIELEFQKHGLGRFLLQSVEFIALKSGFECLTLTVFRINTGAMAFYSKMKYTPAPLSPSVVSPTDTSFDYEILTKSLVKK